ncbi:hypothetical protein LCGC14_1588890, partial [marine sediment metagenome]
MNLQASNPHCLSIAVEQLSPSLGLTIFSS